jgi:drug/metabolite transporter superfamily protein YnfA
MTLRILIFLVLAAMLEVGGDALIRSGLHRRAVVLLLAGAATLVIYGVERSRCAAEKPHECA